MLLIVVLMSKCSNKQGMEGSASAKQNKRAKANVPPSNIATRSRAPPVSEADASDTPTRTDGGNTDGQTSASQNLTSTGSDMPAGNHIVISVRQGINVKTSQGVLVVGCNFFNLC